MASDPKGPPPESVQSNNRPCFLERAARRAVRGGPESPAWVKTSVPHSLAVCLGAEGPASLLLIFWVGAARRTVPSSRRWRKRRWRGICEPNARQFSPRSLSHRRRHCAPRSVFLHSPEHGPRWEGPSPPLPQGARSQLGLHSTYVTFTDAPHGVPGPSGRTSPPRFLPDHRHGPRPPHPRLPGGLVVHAARNGDSARFLKLDK